MSNPLLRPATLAAAIALAAVTGQAGASGFQIRENSTKNLGRANTGSAVARDGSAVYNNPAAMVNVGGKGLVQGDLAGIDLTAKFEGGAYTPTGTLVSGSNGGDPGDLTAVPALAAVFPLHGAGEGLTLGIGVNAPFGLQTDWSNGWVGRYNATTSSVKAVDLTLSAGLQITKGFSAGIGLIYQRAEVELGRALPLGVLLSSANPALATTPDGDFTLTGKNNAFGFIYGLQYRMDDKFSIGYSHRSEIKHAFNGTADFTTPAAYDGVRAGLAANATSTTLPLSLAQRQQLMVLARGFVDSAGRATLVTPAVDTLSAEVAAGDRVRIYGEVQRTGWSSLRSVDVTFANPYQPASSEAFHWKDTMAYGLGADFHINDAFTLRGGVMKDETPTNNADRTPRLPDNDRMIYSLGGTWHATPNIDVDLAYSRIAIKNSTVNLPPQVATATNGLNPANNRYTGLQGTFSGHANVFGVGASYKF